MDGGSKAFELRSRAAKINRRARQWHLSYSGGAIGTLGFDFAIFPQPRTEFRSEGKRPSPIHQNILHCDHNIVVPSQKLIHASGKANSSAVRVMMVDLAVPVSPMNPHGSLQRGGSMRSPWAPPARPRQAGLRLIAPAKDRVIRWMPPIVGTAHVMRSKILTEAANFGYQAIEAEKYSA